ncbi:hypothetical protein [Amycolatopsis sp. H20-H5]|uniref:hypothetical protein n=1 Tax=Amycolatopsis sp. H20-H5 TaxID=3046309 RepID=UPI002DB5CAFD|nr:hypothetical protein [Amycolatopsis sp. H20-H5]MEC3977179.1 hypothetical protein [Amycolatopsis sp. H20-H5]
MTVVEADQVKAMTRRTADAANRAAEAMEDHAALWEELRGSGGRDNPAAFARYRSAMRTLDADSSLKDLRVAVAAMRREARKHLE